MRHVRLPNQNVKKLTSFKRQIGGILKKLNKFDNNDKNEALSHLKNCINEPNSRKTKMHYLRKTKKKLTLPKNVISLKKIQYKCKVCNCIEKNKNAMLKHLETHVGAPQSCIKCKKTFNGSVSFKWHMLHYCKTVIINSKRRKFKCNQCPRDFFSKRTLQSHLLGHKRNNCSYCDKVLTRRVHLIRHLLQVHSVKLERDTYKCDHCEKRYIKKRSLYYHLRQHVPDKYVCLECGHIFDNCDEFETHWKLHEQQKHFCCPKCGEKFSRRQQYLLHMKRHGRYKCLTCNETYASREKVTRHKQQGHDVEGLNPRFICPHCPIAFHREGKLHIHMRKHTDETTVNCKYCKKTFNSPFAYYKHCITISHEKFSPEIRDIVCEKCGKHFTKRYDLRHHIYRVHNATKTTVSCQYCNYKTIHKCNMDRHVSLHFRSANQFTCEYCGKNCDTNAKLRDHITYNHIQEKQFKCDKCEKSFKRNSELVRHQDSHSDERPHVCNLCGKTYKRLNHLTRHEKRTHEILGVNRRIKKVIDGEIQEEAQQVATITILPNEANMETMTFSLLPEDFYRTLEGANFTSNLSNSLN